MSLYHIETEKSIMKDGVEYKADIKKDIVIDFSSASYRIEMWEDIHDAEIELIPDSMDFLHEVTDIFPLSEYDIRIIQSLYRHIKPHISLYLDIRNKETGEKIFFAENAILSDNDYEYIRDILTKEVPQYKWQTAENFLRSDIEGYMADSDDSKFSDDAWHFLSRMVSARYREFKTDGYIDFDCDLMKNVIKEVLEEALRSAYELQDKERQQLSQET